MMIICNIFVKLEHLIFFNNFDKYRKGTSIRQAPLFRHLRALITEKPMEVYYLDEWIIITLHGAGFLHPAIC